MNTTVTQMPIAGTFQAASPVSVNMDMTEVESIVQVMSYNASEGLEKEEEDEDEKDEEE